MSYYFSLKSSLSHIVEVIYVSMIFFIDHIYYHDLCYSTGFFMAFSYLLSCFLTTGKRMISPIILGKIIAKIMESAKFHTADICEAAPIMINTKTKIYK